MRGQIQRLHAREIYDSRGRPTVEVEITCASGAVGRGLVPSGASTGQFEALELRDRGEKRLGGLGVQYAVRNVIDVIGPALIGLDAANQSAIDARLCELDGTHNKARLGANAILGTSLAAAYAAAAAQGIPPVAHFRNLWHQTTGQPSEFLLPMPMVNMISGGLHAGGNLDFQDFLIIPIGATTCQQALEWIVTTYMALGRLLSLAGFEGRLVGDEGGYGPRLPSNSLAAEFVVKAIEAAGLTPGTDVALALDVAATHFYKDHEYRLEAAGNAQQLSSAEMVELMHTWLDSFPIVSIEDPLADEDWTGWHLLTEKLGHRVQLIGDDLFVTNSNRLQQGIDRRVANSVLIKLNQIGTLSETLKTLWLAKQNGYRPVISARSGETEDTTIADLAVATAAGQLKVGSVVRSERLAKYNQLLRLEDSLPDVRFARWNS